MLPASFAHRIGLCQPPRQTATARSQAPAGSPCQLLLLTQPPKVHVRRAAHHPHTRTHASLSRCRERAALAPSSCTPRHHHRHHPEVPTPSPSRKSLPAPSPCRPCQCPCQLSLCAHPPTGLCSFDLICNARRRVSAWPSMRPVPLARKMHPQPKTNHAAAFPARPNYAAHHLHTHTHTLDRYSPARSLSRRRECAALAPSSCTPHHRHRPSTTPKYVPLLAHRTAHRLCPHPTPPTGSVRRAAHHPHTHTTVPTSSTATARSGLSVVPVPSQRSRR